MGMSSPSVLLLSAGPCSWDTSRTNQERLTVPGPPQLHECAHTLFLSFPYIVSFGFTFTHLGPTCVQVHHSSFCKPDAEHLAAHILSHLPCHKSGGDWCMNDTHRVCADAFAETNMVPVLAKGGLEAHTAAANNVSDARSA